MRPVRPLLQRVDVGAERGGQRHAAQLFGRRLGIRLPLLGAAELGHFHARGQPPQQLREGRQQRTWQSAVNTGNCKAAVQALLRAMGLQSKHGTAQPRPRPTCTTRSTKNMSGGNFSMPICLMGESGSKGSTLQAGRGKAQAGQGGAQAVRCGRRQSWVAGRHPIRVLQRCSIHHAGSIQLTCPACQTSRTPAWQPVRVHPSL